MRIANLVGRGGGGGTPMQGIEPLKQHSNDGEYLCSLVSFACNTECICMWEEPGNSLGMRV